MAVQEMTRVAMDDLANSKWMRATISMAEGEFSEPYNVPKEKIYAIAASQTTGTLQFTFASPAEIADDSATYEDWDGTSAISFAITGFRLKHTEGQTSSCVVLIKTCAA